MKCRICQSEEVAPDAPASFNVGPSCASRLGIIPMPPPRRPARPCDRCHGMRFVRVIPRELSAEGGDVARARGAPMSLTLVPEVHLVGVFGSKREVDEPTPEHARGLLEAYVCRACGFVEWYCHDPEAIPLGPEFMAEALEYEPRGPYR